MLNLSRAKPLIVFLAALFNVTAGFCDYDQCKDILRDGIRNCINSEDSLDHRIASHKEFCNIAKEKNLTDSNFTSFAKEYANKVSARSSASGGGISGFIDFGPFSLKGSHETSNQDLSTEEKVNLLVRNEVQIKDYFRQNCGSESYSESIRKEATLISSIVDQSVVNAWRDCMHRDQEFVVYSSAAGQVDDDLDQRHYEISISFRAPYGATIDSLQITFTHQIVEVAESSKQVADHWARTGNLCGANCIPSGGKMAINATHMNLSEDGVITVNAKVNGYPISRTVFLPRRIMPKVSVIAVVPGAAAKPRRPNMEVYNECLKSIPNRNNRLNFRGLPGSNHDIHQIWINLYGHPLEDGNEVVRIRGQLDRREYTVAQLRHAETYSVQMRDQIQAIFEQFTGSRHYNEENIQNWLKWFDSGGLSLQEFIRHAVYADSGRSNVHAAWHKKFGGDNTDGQLVVAILEDLISGRIKPSDIETIAACFE